jgi:hypothetical protein
MERLAPLSHFLPVTTLRRMRLLPVPGKVLVRKGQKVSATDVVAETNLAPEHLLIDAARGLGLPVQETDTHLQRRAGDDVMDGDILAGPVGLGRRVIRAPKSGKIVFAGEGQILMELDSPLFELKAGLPGIVTELYTDRGVEIEAVGGLVQGVWGNGKTDFGLLNVQMSSPNAVLMAGRLDVSQRGAVILGGICDDPEVLTAANDIPVRGLILSSLDSGLIPMAMKMKYPIMLVEGFGSIPMNPVAYKLLTTSERREIAINAVSWDRLKPSRPEALVQLPAAENPASQVDSRAFEAGQRVRVVSALPKMVTGVLASLKPAPVALPSGIRAQAAEVRLESGELLIVPLANLEVMD